MKYTTLFCSIGFSLVILASIIWFGTSWYGVIDTVQGVTVLNSDSEVFIFIGHSKAVLKESRFKLLVKHFTSMLFFPDHVADDMLVVNLKEDKILKYDLKKFSYGGSPFVYHNEVYWNRGRERGDNEQNKLKWNSSKFSPLSEAETSLLDYNHIKDIDELTRAEGWDLKSFNTGDSKPETTIHTLDGDVKVFAVIQPQTYGMAGHLRIMLIKPGNTNFSETLIDIIQGYQTITQNEYLRLKSNSMISNTSGGQND